VVALIFRPFSRNRHLWVTGKTTSWEYKNSPPAFFDNAKYFYLFLINNTNEKVYWITSSKREYDLLHSMNLPVVMFPSIKGIYLTLRAKYSFHHYGSDQINYILQRGQVQFDFWHGTAIKRMRYDVAGEPPLPTTGYKKFMCKGSAEYIFSTSSYLSKNIIQGAFATTLDKILNFGYPRTDIFGLSDDENIEFCKKYSKELLPYINKCSSFSNVLLYMPTFRDDDPDYFVKANIDFERMSKALKKINGIFFLKLHPLTKITKIREYDNILQISSDVDIYPFLRYTNYLITDYSSIFYDYLLLNKEIIYIPYDFDHYVKSRKLYFKYDDITPGKKYYTFGEFIDDIPNLHKLNFKEERDELSVKFIEDYHFDACSKTYEFSRKL